MDTNKGKIINDAFEIMKRTFKELNRLKDDFSDLITDYDPSIKYIEEYSPGSSKALTMKPNQTYLFKRESETYESETIREEHSVVIICIFSEWEYVNRINLKDQPEIWIGLLDIKRNEPTRPWDYWNCLGLERRKSFKDKELRIGGEVFEYYWTDEKTDVENNEEWRGKFIGYPLVEITSRDALKEKVLDKLIEIEQQ